MSYTSGKMVVVLIAAVLPMACSADKLADPPDSDNSDESPIVRRPDDSSRTLHRSQPRSLRGVTPHTIQPAQRYASPAASQYLKAEATFVGQGGLESGEVEHVLLSREAFTGATEALNEEAVRSIEAQDLTKYVRGVIERGLTVDMEVSSLSCGVSVCIGSVQKSSDFERNWSISQIEDASMKFHAVAHSFDRIGAVYENRFVFSTDPDLRNFVGLLSE